MKKILSTALASLMLFAFVACGGSSTASSNNTASSGTEADTIKIGAIGPLTGDVSQYGKAALQGAELAVEELNANGGILGKQVELIQEDDKGDPTDALNAYNKLVQIDEVVAIVGAVTTKPTLAVAGAAAKDGTPLITPSASGADVTKAGENIFRACFTDPYQGELMAHYAQDEMNAKTAAVLYDSGDDYSSGIAETFKATAEKIGLEITAYEGYQSKTSDFNVQLTTIKEGNPDVILVPTYYGDAAQIVVQANNLGIKTPFLGSDGWDGILNEMDSSNYSLLDNSIFCSQYSDNDPSPELEAFLTTYREKYGPEMMFSVLGYESVMILAQAMETAGTTESEAVVAAMKSIEYAALAGGKVTFPSELNDPARDAYMVGFASGEAVVKGSYNFQ